MRAIHTFSEFFSAHFLLPQIAFKGEWNRLEHRPGVLLERKFADQLVASGEAWYGYRSALVSVGAQVLGSEAVLLIDSGMNREKTRTDRQRLAALRDIAG